MLRQLIFNCDVQLGRLFPLQLPAYIQEPILKDGAGLYTRDEWSQARMRGYRNAGVESAALDSNESYLRRIFSTHVYDLHAMLRLIRTVDFNRYRAVFELGCGEMIQAFVLTSVYPHLRYKATDFDPYIINKCSGLPLLQRLEKGVVDVARLTAADLRGFDLVLSWELLYALDDAKLTALFRAAGAAGVPVLACTSQLTGPIRWLWRSLKNLNWRPGGFYYRRLENSGSLRRHGWQPSLGYYDRLAQEGGLRLARVWHPPPQARRFEVFHYLLFQPSSP